MSTLWGWAAAVMVGCAPAPADDSFRNRLSAACETEAGCRALAQETETRALRCRTESECFRAHSDLAAAKGRLSDLVRRRESDETRAQAERLAKSKEERERHDREVAEHAKTRQQQREEREQAKHEAREREAAHMRFLGPEGRRRDLVGCYEQQAQPSACVDTVAKLLAATSDERERRSLIALNEKTMQRKFDTAREPLVGQILCCDGSISETCACGGKLKNCCPRRGGVCGCTKAPTPSAQAASQ